MSDEAPTFSEPEFNLMREVLEVPPSAPEWLPEGWLASYIGVACFDPDGAIQPRPQDRHQVDAEDLYLRLTALTADEQRAVIAALWD